MIVAKSVAASCSTFLSLDFKSQRDLTWSYHQCFMIALAVSGGHDYGTVAR